MKLKITQACIILAIAATLIIHAQAPHGTASEEVPRGVIDGTNTIFTLNFQPAPWGSIHVYRNGLRQWRNFDYILGGPNHMQIIFFSFSPECPLGCIPQPGDPVNGIGPDRLLVDYTY
jgi:hypothetical protein